MQVYDFREKPPFTREWHRLRLTDEDLAALQLRLMINPEEGKVIPGKRGLRKLRIRVAGRGKRGGARVLYVVYHIIRLIEFHEVYAKNE
jgi:hypothetical protein